MATNGKTQFEKIHLLRIFKKCRIFSHLFKAYAKLRQHLFLFIQKLSYKLPTLIKLVLLNTMEKSFGVDKESGADESVIELRPSLEAVETIIDYTFKDKLLLEQAFTDSSVAIGVDKGLKTYERLEYVGDAALNFVVSTKHFTEYPDLAPGKLTRLRAANVDTEKLARAAVHHGLYEFLYHRRPFLDHQVSIISSSFKILVILLLILFYS